MWPFIPIPWGQRMRNCAKLRGISYSEPMTQCRARMDFSSLLVANLHHEVIWNDDCSDASQRTNNLLGPSWANSARFQQGFQFNKVLGGSLWPCLVQHFHVRRLCQALRCVIHVSCFGRTEHTVPKHDRETCHTCSDAQKRWVVASKTMLFFEKPKKLDLVWCELWVWVYKV